MTLLPDIIKEPKIVSGNVNISNSTSNTATANNNLPATLVTSFEMTRESLDLAAQSLPDTSRNKAKVTLKKKQNSLSAKDAGSFPNLIYNDQSRSTAYHRQPRPSDFLNAQNSPVATRLIYNWKPVERLTTKVVQAKVKIYKPTKRIDQPARPPSPYRVKGGWETVDPHFHNQARSQEMKRLQYLKEHTGWSVYPYASIDEREVYNKNIRETLKEQMEHKELLNKKEYEKKLLEFKIVALQDANMINEDKQKRIDKYKYLSTYRDENKQLMQDKWMHNYILKKHEWQQESQLLEQDPINWSKTLK